MSSRVHSEAIITDLPYLHDCWSWTPAISIENSISELGANALRWSTSNPSQDPAAGSCYESPVRRPARPVTLSSTIR